jgi:dTDP-4-amino-4,6-dideoxygalactose transaminase
LELLQPLAKQGFIRLPGLSCDCAQNGHIFYILTGSLKVRDGLLHHLRQAGIHAVFHYVPLHSSPAGKRLCRSVGDMAVTNRVSNHLLRLPLFYEMQEDDINRVVAMITEYFNTCSIEKDDILPASFDRWNHSPENYVSAVPETIGICQTRDCRDKS